MSDSKNTLWDTVSFSVCAAAAWNIPPTDGRSRQYLVPAMGFTFVHSVQNKLKSCFPYAAFDPQEMVSYAAFDPKVGLKSLGVREPRGAL